METTISALAGWPVLGGLVGFWYGWRKLRHSHQRAIATINEIESDEPPARRERRKTIGYVLGVRLFVASVSAVVGAVLGAIISSIALLSLYLI
jgi:hypothetical protein